MFHFSPPATHERREMAKIFFYVSRQSEIFVFKAAFKPFMYENRRRMMWWASLKEGFKHLNTQQRLSLVILFIRFFPGQHESPLVLFSTFAKRAMGISKGFRFSSGDLRNVDLSLWNFNIQKAYNFSKQFILLIRLKHKISKEEFTRVSWTATAATERFCMETLPGRRLLR